MVNTTLDRSDMQGILVSSYPHLTCAAYQILQVVDSEKARAWIAGAIERITKAEKKQEGFSFNIAFTVEGLEALGLPPDVLRTFPSPMQDGGMASARRARVLGDVSNQAPQNWRWGGLNGNPVHVMLFIFGANDTIVDEMLAKLKLELDGAFVLSDPLKAGRQPDSREHFGFADGIGQPVILGAEHNDRQKKRTGHQTVLATGEFILGYPNEDGVHSISPSISAHHDVQNVLPIAEFDPERRDLGANGSYVVFRHLLQDVLAFSQSMETESKRLFPAQDLADAKVLLSSKLVGRWPSGAALVLHRKNDPESSHTPLPEPDNNFGYRSEDPHGLACPFGAHIRRANPRDGLGPNKESAITSVRRHRLLRRGRSFGDRYNFDKSAEENGERGLYFICFNSDIERQFEFVQQTWMNNPGFDGLDNEIDPLTGAESQATGHFSIQSDPVRIRVKSLKAFVRMIGGAYMFLPGIHALRTIAQADWKVP